ncbi:serine--tRNA ligase [Methylophilaceae bacterium]|jgi:seryl-tRNA synthetase|nr:serine--tRNA ligase [Nitrosomonadales bacterium]MCH9842200.1 serine--tRNA ligase [Betaproteobacteria bacterium]MDA7751630.1 serine--tRNA ligase [Methylophilaceae bacterium]MDA9085835.1 serine--tRNA ligase [Methylophilaceae bacterium]MDA9096889.1 serine--tRNA ligase [Methylophilaceae bacterium]
MIDINQLRNELDEVSLRLKSRGFKFDTALFTDLETQRKVHQVKAQELQEKRNDISKKIGIEKSKGNEATDLMADVTQINESLKEQNDALTFIQKQIHDYLLKVPNLPHKSVPQGLTEDDNVIVRELGEKKLFDFEIKDHVDLGHPLGLDFDMGIKLSGARFAVIRSNLALLHRALGQFMLDTHTREHNYEECYTPYLVNNESLLGTGQLPKFEEDLFNTKKGGSEDNLFLIPTGEVPLTNFVRDVIVDKNELPIRLTALTPCFRSEAGSYGKDTRGMIRQHQFDKVEMVQIAHPESSYEALDEMLGHAESIMQKLALPYRVISLCAGDMGFGATKTFDIEVWVPSQNCYREISSVSNCEDFQARRLKARFRDNDKKNKFLHTLNGSGVAVGRAMVAVMENYQLKNGDIEVPEVLIPYMGGVKVITS